MRSNIDEITISFVILTSLRRICDTCTGFQKDVRRCERTPISDIIDDYSRVILESRGLD